MIMAGMLPGVESARRRRMRPSGTASSQSGSRRSSFCLYATGLEPHLGLNSLQRSGLGNGSNGGTELGNVAREAKGRLDEKLRSQRTTEIKRHNSLGSGDDRGDGAGSVVVAGNVQREVYSKKACRKFSWTRMGWKALEQKECAVCLDEFKTGDVLMHLPCSHRFHWSCAVPWLEATSHCPCCRMAVAPQKGES
ncbi:putative E3 ubiquitin-protein ligase ATL44 [Iris pallida]|uniref:E3 ubiquitin-protein ligase ATL44 n=1 Tax=Iris pallida TaxID=29817 RepID=A0AAX6GRW5_IRIPA|nr:putative E3 ubiquitin-protein ligase ATL44 [Iris pallida]